MICISEKIIFLLSCTD